ncbi:hypothetical protein PINS_up008606 [Pythium insidiosum]|nr:hypothetical protein PINS_up008606 [Pythium insidiosum]
MGKKPKNSAKSASGSASNSPKPAQVGPAPVGGASPVKKAGAADAKSPIKDAAEKVDRALQRRKSIEEVQDAGIMKSPEDVEKLAQVAESIGEKIEARPDQEEMLKVNEHILNPAGANRRLSGVLASTAKELEKKITADKIDRHLGSRPEPDAVLDTNIAPSLQSIQKKLQRQMSSDELSHRLESRPDVQELKDQGIVKEGIAPSLQATQDKLQRQMNADRVHQSLAKRPSLDELSAQGLLDKADTQMAPSLTATAKKLERNLVQNHVAHLLETRPDKDELVSSNILEDPSAHVSPALQGAKHQLERQLKADELARHLRKRPSVSELEEKGIVEEGELGASDFSNVQKKCSLSRRARYTLALKAASRIAADNLISPDEKARLKDLILTDNEKVIAAIECYELDQDIEEMLDTLYRVAKLA